MANIRQHVDDLNAQILQGQIVPAFDHYYHDDIVMVEPNGDKREGKAANRKFEESFVNGLQEFRGAEVKSVAIDEENSISYVLWHYDYTHKDFGVVDADQLSMQKWQDGKIIEEHFFYA